jgi:hypothetical protein
MCHVLHVSGAHYALVEDTNVHEELIESDILLGEGAYEVVILQPSDSQHGGAIQLRVVQAIQ